MIPDLSWTQWFLLAYLALSWVGVVMAITMVGKARQPYTSKYAIWTLVWAVGVTALFVLVLWPEL